MVSSKQVNLAQIEWGTRVEGDEARQVLGPDGSRCAAGRGRRPSSILCFVKLS